MVLRLTLPADQDRLNAAVYECARLRVTGEIRIPGAWDAACATDYYETRTGAIVGQLSDSDFIFNGKHVFFGTDHVAINSVTAFNAGRT